MSAYEITERKARMEWVDRAAIAAMQSLLDVAYDQPYEQLASLSYTIADAMWAERERRLRAQPSKPTVSDWLEGKVMRGEV